MRCFIHRERLSPDQQLCLRAAAACGGLIIGPGGYVGRRRHRVYSQLTFSGEAVAALIRMQLLAAADVFHLTIILLEDGVAVARGVPVYRSSIHRTSQEVTMRVISPTPGFALGQRVRAIRTSRGQFHHFNRGDAGVVVAVLSPFEYRVRFDTGQERYVHVSEIRADRGAAGYLGRRVVLACVRIWRGVARD